MATGIVSTALAAEGAHAASALLLVLALAGYALLLAAYAWRLVRWRRRFLADVVGAGGFAFLTSAAAPDVLAARLALDRHTALAAGLLAVGVTAWVLLGYGVPLGMISAAARRPPSLDQVNGTWFVWGVGTESVAVAAATLSPHVLGDGLAALASVCWAIGLLQYLLTAGLVLARLLLRPLAPAGLAPPYWIFMGAAAITVLAGARLLGLPAGATPLPRPAVAALCFVLWSFCTWLIPLLLALGAWRHLLRRVPLRYETGLWGMVFPIGMYGVATRELGNATGTSWLTSLGSAEGWPAAALWSAVFLLMLAAAPRALRPPTHPGPSPEPPGSPGPEAPPRPPGSPEAPASPGPGGCAPPT
ncbi:hypothetical protein D7294_25165 [Streptomyces hoynatensis]|uniref:Tellurite resistance protein permease n=2 Tax=Streptomyces hoynatensis TaxID=1141874 RepID=A0A3A9YPV4_9ACTN|nr:hypothetical protein D7294_25165 [Streptomyces hoynatensis]